MLDRANRGFTVIRGAQIEHELQGGRIRDRVPACDPDRLMTILWLAPRCLPSTCTYFLHFTLHPGLGQ